MTVDTTLPSMPPVLRRETSADYRMLTHGTSIGEPMDVDDDPLTRFLNYECEYRICKYKNPLRTWGWIAQNDYAHFYELLSQHCPVDSKTYANLSLRLKPEDKAAADTTTRFINTPDGILERRNRLLSMRCGHNGRMKGKTWGYIYDKHYDYFLWSVGNAMGRQTRTFATFVDMLTPTDREMVHATPKGKVKVERKKKGGKKTK